MIVCDTGPLVAAALSNDDDHHACVELLTGLRLAERQVLVPATVVAEVGYLLAREAGAAIESMFLRSLSNGDLVPVELGTDDYARMADLVDQYADFPELAVPIPQCCPSMTSADARALSLTSTMEPRK